MSTPVHLDTCFLLHALQSDSSEAKRLAGWLAEGRAVRMSVMAWAEVQCGPFTDGQRALVARLLGDPLTLQARHGDLAARLFNASGRRRGSLPDCLIAAAAIDADAPLATTDAGFERFAEQGLQMA